MRIIVSWDVNEFPFILLMRFTIIQDNKVKEGTNKQKQTVAYRHALQHGQWRKPSSMIMISLRCFSHFIIASKQYSGMTVNN